MSILLFNKHSVVFHAIFCYITSETNLGTTRVNGLLVQRLASVLRVHTRLCASETPGFTTLPRPLHVYTIRVRVLVLWRLCPRYADECTCTRTFEYMYSLTSVSFWHNGNMSDLMTVY